MKQADCQWKRGSYQLGNWSAVAVIPFGTDTFVLEEDKIRYHTVSAAVNLKTIKLPKKAESK